MGGTTTPVLNPGQEGLIPKAKGAISEMMNPTKHGKNAEEILNGGGDQLFPKDIAQMPNIQQGTSIQDVQGAQNRTGEALNGQDALLKALQAQGGLGMQNTAAQSQLGLANQLQSANGVGAQQNALAGLQNTAGLYQNIAQGRGPNPAQAMLNQATGQNVANQAALMAGQRGAGANVGLMARQAAQQGAGLQQQAVGQGATMQANQQLNALQGLTGAQQAMGSMGSNLTGQQMGANQAYANQGNTIAGQQIAGTNANTQANLANQQQMQGALQGVNNSNVAGQASVNTGNVELAKANAAAKQGMLGGVMNSLGSILGARGGMVHMADGGMPAPAMQGPSSDFGQYMMANSSNGGDPNMDQSAKLVESASQAKPSEAPKDSGAGALAGIGAMLLASKGGLAKTGGHVAAGAPSQKADKSGNSYSNDKIPAMLSEGEIVLPRSVTQSKDPKGAAAKFVAQVLARKKVRK